MGIDRNFHLKIPRKFELLGRWKCFELLSSYFASRADQQRVIDIPLKGENAASFRAGIFFEVIPDNGLSFYDLSEVISKLGDLSGRSTFLIYRIE